MHNDRTRRHLLALGLAAAMAPGAVRPQPMFHRTVRLVLGSPPGGSVDALARSFAQNLSQGLGVPVIVENRPGGSNKIASDLVARSAPDGHVLLGVGSSTPLTEAAALSSGGDRPFDTLRDFTPIGTIAANTYALVVSSSLEVKTIAEFIALARSKPGFVSYGSSGIAKTDHVAAELFAQGTGIKMLHVPFKGLGEIIAQMLGGRIHAAFSAAAPMAPHIRSGKMRILGIVGGERSQMFPGIPTIAQAVPLPGYRVDAWIGYVAPARTPPAVVSRLNAEIARMLGDEAFVKQVLLANGLEPFPSSSAEMAAMFRGEVDKYAGLFKDINLKLE